MCHSGANGNYMSGQAKVQPRPPRPPITLQTEPGEGSKSPPLKLAGRIRLTYFLYSISLHFVADRKQLMKSCTSGFLRPILSYKCVTFRDPRLNHFCVADAIAQAALSHRSV